ncbi:MAG: hypothetical protein ACU0CJ_09950 [Sulfitobacter sp.]|uniref:hypothetical protein n=1 Tax=unclassified Sulfitobacter TaxID=196795 RepID=UPI0007C2D78C|nr:MULTISPECIES: hypothetical protein [unclassified Sulfitobacter]KZX94309.1 hypothetical protein A3720_22010 [Sulfitobacter sp. HI0021]KZX95621.1 hypothetical protein A3722_02235 [Sulfitobacter sp. HI0027]KZZ03358.1 hypothetical protein A3747_11980 [Sulfitobacter sp. HI0076]
MTLQDATTPYSAMTVEAETWMPPAAPLAMPRQTLERRGHLAGLAGLAGLADVARAFLLRRKA